MARDKGWKEAAVAFVFVLLVCGPAFSYYDEYSDSEAHPLRLAAYALHPAGYALEWLVMRPLHAILSQPQLEPVFGHGPHGVDFGYAPPTVVTLTPVAPPAARAAPPEPAPAEGAGDQAAAAKTASDEAKAAARAAEEAAQRAERAFEKTERAFEKTLTK